VSFAGDLKKLPLGDVFQSIHQNALTGALAVRDQNGERLVAFKQGFVVGAAPPVGEEHGIADELVRRKLISQKEARPSRFFRRRGALQKTVVKKAVMSEQEYASLVRTVVLERVYDCFLVEEGTFEFLEKYEEARFDDDELAVGLKIGAPEILMEAMRRVDEFKRIRRSIPSWREVYVATRAPEESDPPIARDILVLTSSGDLQLHGVFQAVAHTKFACCEAVLSLVNAGALRVATAPEYLDLGKKAEEKQDLEAAASYYARGLAYERGNKELNLRRITVLERLHRNQEAADERKLFAGTLLEVGDKRGAAEHYAKAAQLATTDPLPLERLLDLHVEAKNLGEARETADRLVRVYLQLGLGEKAKAVFPRLLVLSPRDRGLRERLADIHAKLNEPSTAATIWKELAQEELDKGDVHDSAMFLRRALEAQPDDPASKALLKDLETGEHAERKKRLRLRAGLAAVTLLVSLFTAQVAAERQKLAFQRTLEADGLRMIDRGPEAVLGLIEAREAHRAAFQDRPWAFKTLLGGWDREASEELVRLYVRELARDVRRPRYEPQPQREKVTTVLDELRRTLRPEGQPSLEQLIVDAETLLQKNEHDAAWGALSAPIDRMREARLLLARAGSGGRDSQILAKEARAFHDLTGRLHVLWARLAVREPANVHALEMELVSTLAPVASVIAGATKPRDPDAPKETEKR
jgi:tetratricopeptide (TPR) repeat protein